MPRILVIDDEPDNLLLLKRALRQLGYEDTVTESDPLQGIERFQSEAFDLVLLDYNMPDISGLEVLAHIAPQARQDMIPVVMVTAQADRDTRLLTLNAGAKDFITKPIDLPELTVRIGNLLETRRLQQMLYNHNLQLEDTVRQRTQELHSTRLEIIRRLARAAEFRDNETGLHVQRMSLYAQAIGRQLELDPAMLDLMLNACPMHDVGKIGITDTILLKPGRLAVEEFEVMKRHTTIGADILYGHESPLLQMAHEIALHHHEKWDGSGYPHGLSGEAIPLTARIAAVADVFDALTMERPYKKAWAVTDARDEIARGAGKHFDPKVSDAFLTCFDEILTIRADNPDRPS